MSLPASANPTTFALDDCACSRKDEKSDVLIGERTAPRIRPPFSSMNCVVSRWSAVPNE